MTPKKSVTDLAIFGGAPAFEELLHVGRPNIVNRERFMARINDILDRRWLSNMGPYSQELERQIEQFIGVKHCIAMCNGTVALEIAIRALDLTGEVIVPSMTFIATPHALQWQEVTPVFCDIDAQSLNIDPGRVEEMITPRTTGIIGVHLWGRACNIEALSEVARRRRLKLLFDAAHAFGCSYKGQMIGSFGDAEVFSFHATKCFTTMEGGAVVTNSDELAKKIRLMMNFGFGGMDQVVYIGTNGKMNEVEAAMGVTALEELELVIARNRDNYDAYARGLSDVPGLRLVRYDESEKNNFHYVVVEIEEDVTGISRDTVVEILRAENILARRYFYPGCHRMEPYRSYCPQSALWLPQTERVVRQVLVLPTGTAIEVEAIERICHIIRLILREGPSLQADWESRMVAEKPGLLTESVVGLDGRQRQGRVTVI